MLGGITDHDALEHLELPQHNEIPRVEGLFNCEAKSMIIVASQEKETVVALGMMSDTRFNWELSKHIFRYGHGNMIEGELDGIHTVNEYIKADSFVKMITFFTTLIFNADVELE
ncbi:hypothetical protein K438DRAFT_1952440 [Mycena galopus ATCC 62051]|nr:hypothetical protein K438DRAFT_1952440 [Mycena galopus ATCC 62051]